MPGTVTISASFGAGGDRVGRAVAERLGLPLLDRAIPAAEAHRLDQLPEDIGESLDEHVPSRWERIAQAFANTATPVGPSQVPIDLPDGPEQFRARHEESLRQLAESTGGVVLGRAGMVVLGGRPDVLCVRLDGPVEARIRRAVAEGVEEEQVRRLQKKVDGTREAYARVFFNARQDDASLYHLVIDSTALSLDACVGIVVRAAWDRFGFEGA